MRVDFADGGVRLTDGRLEWNSTAQGKPYTKKPVPWDSRGRRAFHEFYYNYEGIADFVKSADFISPPGKDGFLIEVTYELPGRIAGEVTKSYWIDAQHYTVLRETSNPMAMMDPPTAGPVKLTRTITFEKVDLNAPVDASLFAPPPDEPQPSGPAPDFALSDLEGAPVSMKDLRGKAVVLYFWATWCATCRAEMPKLEKLARRLCRPRPGAARHQRRRSADRRRISEDERPRHPIAGGPLEGRLQAVQGRRDSGHDPGSAGRPHRLGLRLRRNRGAGTGTEKGGRRIAGQAEAYLQSRQCPTIRSFSISPASPSLVVGAGKVALRKTKGLLEAGAAVTVVAPRAEVEFARLSVTLRRPPPPQCPLLARLRIAKFQGDGVPPRADTDSKSQATILRGI